MISRSRSLWQAPLFMCRPDVVLCDAMCAKIVCLSRPAARRNYRSTLAVLMYFGPQAMGEQDSTTALLPPPDPDGHAPTAPAGLASASAGGAAPAQHARRGSWHAGPAVEPIRIDLRRGAGSSIGAQHALHQGRGGVSAEAPSLDSSSAATEGGPRITLQQAAEIWAETPPGAGRRRRQQWAPDSGSSCPIEPASVAAASIASTAGDLSSGRADAVFA